MSLEINGKKFTTCDESALSEAMDVIQKLPPMTVLHTVTRDASHTMTILQDEKYFVEAGGDIDSVATLFSNSCMFLICKGKTEKGVDAFFASHLDTSYRYCAKDNFLVLQHHPIEIYVVGGEVGSADSLFILKTLVRYFITLSQEFAKQKIKLDFVFKGQRILSDFQMNAESRRMSCSTYLLLQARRVHEVLFEEPLPKVYYEKDFSLCVPEGYRSSIPGVEDYHGAVHTALMEMKVTNADPEAVNQLCHQSANFFRDKFKASFTDSGIDLWAFCEFLFTVDAYHPMWREYFNQNRRVFAGDKTVFETNVSKLFSLAGYDVMRLFLLTQGLPNVSMYEQFAVSFRDMSVRPVSTCFYDIPQSALRFARLIGNMPDRRYVDLCDSKGRIANIVLTPDFLKLCDKYVGYFEKNSNTSAGLDKKLINEICKNFNINFSARKLLFEFMRYYANSKASVAKAPVSAPQNPAGLATALVNNMSTKEAKKAAMEKAVPKKVSGLVGGFLNPVKKPK